MAKIFTDQLVATIFRIAPFVFRIRERNPLPCLFTGWSFSFERRRGWFASGITAIPLTWELSIFVRWFGEGTVIGNLVPGLADWLALVKEGLDSNAEHYPFIAYGTDWLAFAHIMIALAFIGPLRDPAKNIWIIHWGMLCCIGVLPLILIDRWTKRLKIPGVS